MIESEIQAQMSEAKHYKAKANQKAWASKKYPAQYKIKNTWK